MNYPALNGGAPINLPTPTGTPRGASTTLPSTILGAQGAAPQPAPAKVNPAQSSAPLSRADSTSTPPMWSPLGGLDPGPEPIVPTAAPAPISQQPPNTVPPVPPGAPSATPIAAYKAPASSTVQSGTAPVSTPYGAPGPSKVPVRTTTGSVPQRPIASFSHPNASSEDMVRAQVLTLFSQCENDVEKTIGTIARTLRESGRHDVKVESDAKGAIMTISQDMRHASGSKTTEFVQRLNSITERHEKEMAPIRALAQGREYVPPPQPGAPRPNDGPVYHQEDLTKFELQALDAPMRRLPRCFKRTEKDLKRNAFPTSKYNGNYLLQRYGGAFPDHGNYGFYRQYGAKGRGAATAEYHNYPGGLPPQPTSLYQ